MKTNLLGTMPACLILLLSASSAVATEPPGYDDLPTARPLAEERNRLAELKAARFARFRAQALDKTLDRDEQGADKAKPSPNAGPGLRWIDRKTGRTLFSARDIVRFDWQRQVVELTSTKAMDLGAQLPPHMIQWLEFEVRDDKELLYEGRFISAKSSVGHQGPTIVFDNMEFAPPLYAIQSGYPAGSDGPDQPHRARGVEAALKRAGVLAAIPADEKPQPIQQLTTEWIGPRDGLKVRVEIFPETFRIGESARAHVFFAGASKTPTLDEIEIHSTVAAGDGKFFCTTEHTVVKPMTVPEVLQRGTWVLQWKPWGPVLAAEQAEARPGPAEVKFRAVLRDAQGKAVGQREFPALKVDVLRQQAVAPPPAAPAPPATRPDKNAWGQTDSRPTAAPAMPVANQEEIAGQAAAKSQRSQVSRGRDPEASLPMRSTEAATAEAKWLSVQANSAEYRKLPGPELVLVGRIEVAGPEGPCRVAIYNPWLPVADLGGFQGPFAKLRGQRAKSDINRTKILVKAKLKRDRSQGKHPVVVVSWMREFGPAEPDWQMPWPVNLPLLPLEREFSSIPMIVACQAINVADSALEHSGVHGARQRFKVLEIFHGDAKVGQELDLGYSYLEPGMGFGWSGRDVKQGERVIWVVMRSGGSIHGCDRTRCHAAGGGFRRDGRRVL